MGIVLDEIEFKTPGSPLLMLGFLSFFEGATSQRKGDNVPQVNGENTERHAQPPPLPAQSDPELYEKLASSSEINKKSDTVADIESEPVVESTETEGT